jgi:hypothetical protein
MIYSDGVVLNPTKQKQRQTCVMGITSKDEMYLKILKKICQLCLKLPNIQRRQIILFLECTKTLDLSTGFSQNINM